MRSLHSLSPFPTHRGLKHVFKVLHALLLPNPIHISQSISVKSQPTDHSRPLQPLCLLGFPELLVLLAPLMTAHLFSFLSSISDTHGHQWPCPWPAVLSLNSISLSKFIKFHGFSHPLSAQDLFSELPFDYMYVSKRLLYLIIQQIIQMGCPNWNILCF